MGETKSQQWITPNPFLLKKNGKLVFIVIEKKKQNELKAAAPPEKSLDTDVQNLTPSRLKKKSVKAVKSLSPEASKERKKLALYVVKKYILASKVNYPRDIPLCYKLIDKFPSFLFWQGMPCLRQVATMVILYAPKNRAKLEILFKNFLEKLNIQKAVVLEQKRPEIELGEKVGDDRRIETKKPKSILEFCR